MTNPVRATHLFPLLAAPAAGFAAILGCVWLVHRSARGRIIAHPADLPTEFSEFGLVLGTSKRTLRGWPNAHFARRIQAAATLVHAGRIRQLIVSGDAQNSRGANEPADMRESLVALGVPDSSIVEDPAGFRTLDSVVRAKEVFGANRLTIITDGFHAPRAVFLARQHGIDAVAFPSAAVNWRASRKTRLREFAADVRACLDTFVLQARPRTSRTSSGAA